MILKQSTTSVLIYKGKLTFERIGILLNELKNKKGAYDIPQILYKKLLTLMIEVLENILKYSEHFEDFINDNPDYLPEFELSRSDEGFILKSRNPIRNDESERISDKIKKVNTASGEELKRIYRTTITNGVFTEKGGAGLGFIEMAKITSHDLEFTFLPAVSGYSIFELILHINHNEKTNNG